MQQIRCRAIIEMLGAPKEYIDKTLRDYVTKIKNEGAQIVNEKYEESLQQDKLFSNFVEIEILFDKPAQLLSFCFESMPSSIEIIEPDALALPGFELTGFLCDLQARLHEADMIVKTLNVKNSTLNSNSTNVFFNFIKFALSTGPKTHGELAGVVGVEEKALLPFLKELLTANKIKAENGKYLLADKEEANYINSLLKS